MITINVNLLGERAEERIRLPIDQDMLVLLGMGVGGMILAMLLPLIVNLVIDGVLISRETAEAERLNSILGRSSGEVKRISEQRAQLRSLEAEYSMLQRIDSQGAIWPSLLDELRSLTPTEMWLTGVHINGNTLTVDAQALNYRAVAFFYTNLQNSTNYADPVLGGINSDDAALTKPGARNTIAFQVTCKVKTLQSSDATPDVAPSASPSSEEEAN